MNSGKLTKSEKFYVQLEINGHDFVFGFKQEVSITGIDMTLLGNTMLPVWSFIFRWPSKDRLCVSITNMRRKQNTQQQTPKRPKYIENNDLLGRLNY